ncbi:RlpA-like double-psi beta-barrel-protein domain-containing protein-containing protein [Thelephora terrestris]|uniref:RlpA-like double-psi beta-barrel-protein domain-containing protein-containing protein n=1 Tax=Thelephora terrestris TaxID=56493 RepID=A0A9P6HPQ4_9AGAM|nr:RlpA-like double-psi beta-barrel-protein domain-containing protein-containing protein [Thelephora terrestris]
MLLPSVFLILAVYAIGFTPAAATPHSLAKWSSRHNALQPLQKRVSGQFTYFAVGMGACGKQNVESDMVVALNTPLWDGGSHCFETVTIVINGITLQAQIVDRCENCGSGDLDFSVGLFHAFGGTDAQGVMSGTWSFGNSPVPTTTTTEQPKPSSTSTSTSTTPSSTSVPPSSTIPTPSMTTSSGSSPSPSATSNVAIPVPTGVLGQSLFILGALGELVLAGGSVR